METTLDIFEPTKPDELTDKSFDQRRELEEVWETRSDPKTPLGKRKPSDDRQPESPPEIERQNAPSSWNRDKHFRADAMDTDSPASYPKQHVLSHDQRYGGSQYDQHHSKSVSTPVLSNEPSMLGSFDHPTYRPSHSYSGGAGYGQEGGGYGQSRGGHFSQEIETSPQYCTTQPDTYMRPRRWACDYCNVATFVSYEEACAHEDACARQYHERYGGRPSPSRGPIPQYDRNPPAPTPGLGALYHAGQEVSVSSHHLGGRPPWGGSGRGPSMPHLPHHESHFGGPHHQPPGYHAPPRYHRYPGYDGRDGPMHSRRDHHHYRPQHKRMLLAMPTDSDSLSDRQCYVRSEMVEIFAASAKDVSSRHSKGAQKLVEGQVGIRCVHCSHLRARDRAERAVCYPSSISRVYQTVADMQRFHFEQCREIPPEVRKIYKSLKTTRPRGVGSPQTYWIQSAKLLDLVDTGNGIRFGTEVSKDQASKPMTA